MITAISRVANYNLALNAQGVAVDETTQAPFDHEQYSRMKYGDRLATQQFAGELATKLIVECPELVTTQAAPEFFVPFKAVPPACFYLSRYCLDILNEARSDEGNEPGQLLKIHKGNVLASNYAAASSEDRQRELKSISFSLDGHSVEGKHAVVLDDIRITGAAEERMLEVLSEGRPTYITLGYIAIFNAVQAANNPSIEHDLNHGLIQGATDLLPAIKNDNFDLNIRTLKMILDEQPADLEAFISACPDSLVQQLYRDATNTGVAFVEHYKTSVAMLKSKAGIV